MPENHQRDPQPAGRLSVPLLGNRTLGEFKEKIKTWAIENGSVPQVVRPPERGIICRPLLRGITIRRTIVAVTVLGALALPAAAFAGNGLIDQYIEDVPTAGGAHHPGAGSGSGGTGGTGGSGTQAPAPPPATLSSAVQTKLEAKGGKDSDLLRQIATSPSYGAPPATAGQVPTPAASPDPLSAAVGAVTDGSDGRMVGLFVALLAVTAASLGIAAARRRA